MNDIFMNLLVASVHASITAAAVILIKRIFASKLNVRIGYLLWGLVLLRFLFPVLPESRLSIFNALNLEFIDAAFLSDDPLTNDYIEKSKFEADASGHGQSRAPNGYLTDEKSSVTGDENSASVQNSKPAAFVPSAKAFPGAMVSIIPYIWASGAVLVIFYLILTNALFSIRLKKMKQAVLPEYLVERLKAATGTPRRSIRFVESEDMESPCVYGIFRSTIILPAGVLDGKDEKTLSHILLHELAHIKHGDLAVCWIASVICALHWFNPVVWYVLKQIEHDQDLWADAYTMSLLNEHEIEAYGKTLLSMAVKGGRKHLAPVTAGITEDKKTLRKRIVNIAAFSKKKYRVTLAGVLLLMAAGVMLCTSRVNYPGTDEERIRFVDNILLSLNAKDSNDAESFELRIENRNRTDLRNCKLEVLSNANTPDERMIFSKDDFRIPGRDSVKFDFEDVNYADAYVRFSCNIGFSSGDKDRINCEGDFRAFEKTLTNDSWSAATDEEVSRFIKENGINVIGVSRIYGICTIILFENEGSSGYYELYKDNRSGELRSRKIIGYTFEQDKPPIQMMGGTASGNYPFVNFRINSPALLAVGDKIEVQTTKSTISLRMDGKKGHTVKTRGYGSIYRILVYDKTGKMIYDGKRSLLEDVSFRPDDPSYLNIMHEKNYKIIDQTPVIQEINFTKAMFPQKYIVAYKSDDMDWKIPVLTYGDTTVYLKSIVESNESPDYLYALFYFVHDTKGKDSGKILSSTRVIREDDGEYAYTSDANPRRDVILSATGLKVKNAVSLRSHGPGDQIAIYLDRAMVEKSNGEFSVILEGLNQISYASK